MVNTEALAALRQHERNHLDLLHSILTADEDKLYSGDLVVCQPDPHEQVFAATATRPARMLGAMVLGAEPANRKGIGVVDVVRVRPDFAADFARTPDQRALLDCLARQTTRLVLLAHGGHADAFCAATHAASATRTSLESVRPFLRAFLSSARAVWRGIHAPIFC